MKNTYLILLTTEMYFLIVECALAPDINLEGRLIANDVSRVLQLSCTTNIAVQLCTVEFLIDKKTHDTIRYHNNNCYHTKLICYPSVCMCSGDCKSFTLNVTITPDMMNYTYSCASKIENNGVIYTANISVIQDGNGGSTIIKKIVNPSNIGRPPQQATSIAPKIDTVASFSVPLIIVITACGLLFLAIFLIVMAKIKKRNTGNVKEGNEANNDGKKTKAWFAKAKKDKAKDSEEMKSIRKQKNISEVERNENSEPVETDSFL